MLRATVAITLFLGSTQAAMAGIITPTPGPEAGAGIAAMTMLGFGVAWLRKRRSR